MALGWLLLGMGIGGILTTLFLKAAVVYANIMLTETLVKLRQAQLLVDESDRLQQKVAEQLHILVKHIPTISNVDRQNLMQELSEIVKNITPPSSNCEGP